MKFDKRRERYFIAEEGGKEEAPFVWKVPRFLSLVLLIPVELTVQLTFATVGPPPQKKNFDNIKRQGTNVKILEPG
jgi:hypothetical protein